MQRQYGNAYVQQWLKQSRSGSPPVSQFAPGQSVQRCGGAVHPGCPCAEEEEHIEGNTSHDSSTIQRQDMLPVMKAATTARPMLRRGSRGPTVVDLQTKLNSAGADPPLAVDSIFGPKTQAAVIAFQQANELKADGIVGPQTWGALDSAGTGPFKSDRILEKLDRLGDAAKDLEELIPPVLGNIIGQKDCPLTSDPQDELQPADIMAVSNTSKEDSKLLYGFTTLSEQLDPLHEAHLRKVVKQRQLNAVDAPWRATIIQGHIDCREEALRRMGLDDLRAQEVESALIGAGAQRANVASGQAGRLKLLGKDVSPGKLRALHRSVLLTLKKTGTPPKYDGGDPGKDVASKKWSLRTTGSTEAALGSGGIQIAFELWNLTSGKVYSCLFSPTGGFGLTFGLTLSAGGWTNFESAKPVKPDRFLDYGARVGSVAVSGPTWGYADATLQLKSVKTNPSPIDIGGFSASLSFPFGAVWSVGTFSVYPRGQLPGATPTA